MPNDNAIKFGILKCRDLVAIYYGARMVASVIENTFSATSGNQVNTLEQDSRRIKYEIQVVNRSTVNTAFITLGTPSAVGAGLSQSYSVSPTGTLILQRDFLTDLDAVCLPIDIESNENVNVSTRETFLTPTPVDEMP